MKQVLSWKILVGIVIIYTSGLITGVLGTRLQIQKQINSLVSSPQKLAQNFFLRKIAVNIPLTRDQETRVQDILASATMAWAILRESQRPEVDEIFHRSVASVREVLSPEQQKNLDRLVTEIKP